MAIRMDSNGIFLDDKYLPLYSGTIHYWRHSRDDWKPLLEQAKNTGFGVVTIDIPWGVHESGPTIFDFGDKDPSKNIADFIDICHSTGLFLIVQPGPQHDPDIPWTGIPLRLIRNSSFWALTSMGTPAILDAFPQPFPLISYASNRFYIEFSKFLDSLCQILVPRQYPNGPIVLCKAGGTVDFGQRYRAYDIDYSQDALFQYRKYLTDKYHTIDELNELYSSNHVNFSTILPPKSFANSSKKDFLWYLDWIAFKEYLGCESARRVVPLLRERKISVPIFHATHSITSPTDHYSLIPTNEIRLIGCDMTPLPKRLSELAFQVRCLAGTPPFAYISSFPQGADWLSVPALSPGEQEFLILICIMFGASGINFRMLSEYDRWMGSPVTRHGQPREEYASMHRMILNFLGSYRVLETKKYARCLGLINHNIEQFHLSVSEYDWAYLNMLHFPNSFARIPQPMEFAHDPFPQSIYEGSNNWLSKVFQLMESEQIEYNITESNVPVNNLNQYDMVFFPMVDFTCELDFENYIDYIMRGGHMVVGPGSPNLNENLKALTMIKVMMGQLIYKFEKMESPGTVSLEKGKFTWQTDMEAIKKLFTPNMKNAVLQDNPSLWLTIREGPHNIMFLANPTRQEQKTNIISSMTLKGIWGLPDKSFKGFFQTILQPMSIQIMEVLP